MVILVDTNVVFDVLSKHKPHLKIDAAVKAKIDTLFWESYR